MASGKRWLDMDKAENNKILAERAKQQAFLNEVQDIKNEPVKKEVVLMTGDTKRAIITDLIELEKQYYAHILQGEFVRERPYAVLAEKYNCKENKIATIKHFYKLHGEDAFVDDKVRGGFRKGSGKPSASLQKWRKERGYTKENNWGRKE